MKKNKLTPEQEEQIVSMRKEGKPIEEVQAFFKSNYSIELPAWKIHYCVGKARKGGVASDEKPRRNAAQRKYSKKRKGAEDPEAEAVAIFKEIRQLIGQIDNGYIIVFKALRGDLIKSRAQVHEMMKGAGVEIPEDQK